MAAASLASAVLLALLAGCGGKSGVNDTISQFESACHTLDVKGMLKCIDPTIAKPILGAMDLFGVEDTTGTLDQLAGVLDLFDDAGQTTAGVIRSLRLKPNNYVFNDAKDKCTVTAELSYGDGGSRVVILQMVCKDECWYIADMDF